MRRKIVREGVLVLGAVIIIASTLLTVTRCTDHVVFTVLIPGVVAGLILIGVYLAMDKRRNQR